MYESELPVKNKCPQCGKIFYTSGGDWGYMYGIAKLCSYTCMRAYDPHNKKLYDLSALTEDSKREINVNEICRSVNGNLARDSVEWTNTKYPELKTAADEDAQGQLDALRDHYGQAWWHNQTHRYDRCIEGEPPEFILAMITRSKDRTPYQRRIVQTYYSKKLTIMRQKGVYQRW